MAISLFHVDNVAGTLAMGTVMGCLYRTGHSGILRDEARVGNGGCRADSLPRL